MNNLLKIFLIFNLFSSVSPNNYSVPLPEENLMMEQNSSGLVKRKPALFISSGSRVTGITFSHGRTYQRDCTLSFPVMNRDGDKGFITSATCVNTNILVGDDAVGVAIRPFKFDSERGLDYAFVRI